MTCDRVFRNDASPETLVVMTAPMAEAGISELIRQIRDGEISGMLIIDPCSSTDPTRGPMTDPRERIL